MKCRELGDIIEADVKAWILVLVDRVHFLERK